MSDVRGAENMATNTFIAEDNVPDQSDICKAMKELDKK